MKKTVVIALLACQTVAASARDFNIVDYGALNDTTQLSTAALQQAIDDCWQAGGGRVVVPAGSYKIGTVELRSYVNLFLETGATLYGSTSLKDYRPMKSDYVSLRTQTPTIQLLYADKVQHVTISGHGTIDGRGRAFKKPPPVTHHPWRGCHRQGCDLEEQRLLDAALPGLRPSAD